MAFLTPRQRVLSVLVAVVVVATGGLAVIGRTDLAVAGLAGLVGFACALLLDLRHRQQVGARSLSRLEDALAEAVASTSSVHEAVEDHGAALKQTRASLHDMVQGQDETLSGRHRELLQRLARLEYEPVTEIQALLQLLPKVPGAAPLPGVGGWALSASSLLHIWDLIQRGRPTTVVECGSGTSTVWMGYAARAAGGPRVVALEHNATFAARTESLLVEHGLQDVAEVRYAPLQRVEVDGETLSWYSLSGLDDMATVDLLVVDGPPKSTGPLARYPAVPLLRDKLRPGALVVMDDAHRPDEREVLRLWSERHGVELERHLSRETVLLRFPSAAD